MISQSGARYLAVLIFAFITVSISGMLAITGMAIGDVTTEIAESTNDVGMHSSISLDGDGFVHISHYDMDNNKIRYCNNTVGSWSCDVVADGNRVTFSTTITSIAIGSDGKVHISYYDETNADLRYCNNTQGSWTCGIVAAFYGKYPSIAIDSADKIHISSLYPSGNSGLGYCNNTQGSWTCTAFDFGCLGGGNCGEDTAIAIGSDGGIHIIACIANDRLGYCSNTTGSWSCEVVEDRNGCTGASVFLNSTDKVHISYDDSGSDDLIYCSGNAGSWSCETVETTNDVGNYPSIVVDGNDNVHITHHDATIDILRYCNNTVGSWGCATIAKTDSNSLGWPNGLALALKQGRIVDSSSFSDKVHTSWYNVSDLIYSTYEIGNTGDSNAPAITAHNLTAEYPTNISILFNFTDATTTDTMSINDTTNFEMNKTGFLFNISYLTPLISFRRYWLNITANDSFNNTGSVEIWINITDTTDPTITTHNLSVTHPANVSVLFNFTDAVGTDTMSINDTTNFEMNKTGFLFNISFLSAGQHWLNISANDTSNNTADVEVWINVSSTTSTTTTVVTETTESLGAGLTTSIEEETTIETTEETTIAIETTQITETTEVAEENIFDIISDLFTLEQPKSAIRFMESFGSNASQTIADFKAADEKGISNMTLKCSLEQITAEASEFEYVDEVDCENSIICRWIREMQKKNVTEECRLVIVNADGYATEKAFDIMKVGHPEPIGLAGEKVIFGLRLSRDWPWLFLLLLVIIYLIIRTVRYLRKNKSIRYLRFFKKWF